MERLLLKIFVLMMNETKKDRRGRFKVFDDLPASPDQISLAERSSIRDFYKSPFLNKRASFLESLKGEKRLKEKFTHKKGGLDDIQ